MNLFLSSFIPVFVLGGFGVSGPQDSPSENNIAQAILTIQKSNTGFLFDIRLVREHDRATWVGTLVQRSRRWTEIVLDASDLKLLAKKRVLKSEEIAEVSPKKVKVSAQAIAKRAIAYRKGVIVEIELDRAEALYCWDVYVKSNADGKIYELEFDARNGAFRGIEVQGQ